ncbi:MAG: dienelactone hydrolase family protein [Parachlamydiales bacterium]|nr:dienelactone hydrolase family protein [Parachlamydiales bacterium]
MAEIQIEVSSKKLFGDLHIPKEPIGLVIFAHGSGSGRHSPRNQFVAKKLQERKLATLLFDLLTLEEEAVDDVTRELRFNIAFLAERLVQVTDWAAKHHPMPVGFFGASTGAGAALQAASIRDVKAVVSRGGRPDLAKEALSKVKAPTLLIVGSLDPIVIELNEEALQMLHCTKKLEIVDGASHLFEEKGKLEIVAQLAGNWFVKYLAASG